VLVDERLPAGEAETILIARSGTVVFCGRCGDFVRGFLCEHGRMAERLLKRPL
jgi:hypothetical protein